MTVPKSVEIIEEKAFYDCENLRRAIFEQDSKLEEIGWNCFQNSGLEEIALPKTLREIG